MRRLLLGLLVVCASAPAADRLALIGVREDTRVEPDEVPPGTAVTFDVFSPVEQLGSRRVLIRDKKTLASLYSDPFVIPTQEDLAYLFVTEDDHLRCLRISWTREVDLGPSFAFPLSAPTSRPLVVAQERMALFDRSGLLTLDLRLGTHIRSEVKGTVIGFAPDANRLYVSKKKSIAFYPILSLAPSPKIENSLQALTALPDDTRPERVAVRGDGTRAAYWSPDPSLRPDARRFLLSVTDRRPVLLLRRSFPGSPHDLRWLDDDRLLLTATDGERTAVHVVTVATSQVRTMHLAQRYLAPPEIAEARLLGIGAAE